MTHANTDLYRNLQARQNELRARLATLKANSFDTSFSTQAEAKRRNDEWIRSYEKELAAYARAIWALGDEA